MSKKHPRVLKALVDRVWALHPDKLEQIVGFVSTRLAGGEVDFLAGPEPSTKRQAATTEYLPYEVLDGVAVIEINDVLDRRLNLFQSISGGMSTQMLAKNIEHAAGSPDVLAILLDVDSPGGSVFGTEELAGAVSRAKERKPVVAYTGALMCSAAYWVGSATDAIVAMGTAEVGSIGVACVHYDYSESDRQDGVKRTVISAGKYKRIASDEKPLTEEGQAYLQGQVDTFYSLFVDAVAANRGVSVEDVLSRMADGKTFIGTQALEAGLVDHIGDMSAALDLARQLATKGGHMSGKTAQAGADTTAGLDFKALTLSALETERPDLVSALVDKGKAEGLKAGAESERARVLGIMDLDGDEKTTRACIEGGQSAEASALAVLKAEREGRAEGLKGMTAALGAGVPAEGKEKNRPEADFMALAKAHQKETGCTLREAMSHVAHTNPAAYEAYQKKNQKQEGN